MSDAWKIRETIRQTERNTNNAAGHAKDAARSARQTAEYLESAARASWEQARYAREAAEAAARAAEEARAQTSLQRQANQGQTNHQWSMWVQTADGVAYENWKAKANQLIPKIKAIESALQERVSAYAKIWTKDINDIADQEEMEYRSRAPKPNKTSYGIGIGMLSLGGLAVVVWIVAFLLYIWNWMFGKDSSYIHLGLHNLTYNKYYFWPTMLLLGIGGGLMALYESSKPKCELRDQTRLAEINTRRQKAVENELGLDPFKAQKWMTTEGSKYSGTLIKQLLEFQVASLTSHPRPAQHPSLTLEYGIHTIGILKDLSYATPSGKFSPGDNVRPYLDAIKAVDVTVYRAKA